MHPWRWRQLISAGQACFYHIPSDRPLGQLAVLDGSIETDRAKTTSQRLPTLAKRDESAVRQYRVHPKGNRQLYAHFQPREDVALV